jgi:ABC-type nitrate/sulfonate/bicarbonate transport system substrate-binding protein
MKYLLRRRACTPLAAILIAVTAMLVAACGNGGSSSAGGQSGMPTLNYAVGSPIVNYGSIWVALANNLFEKNGVKVNIVSYSAQQTAPAQLVSNKIDLISSAPVQALQIAAGGKQTSIVFALANFNGYFLAFLARPGIKSFADLKAMGSNCTIASQPAGSGTLATDRLVMKAYGLQCKLIQEANISLVATTVEAGQADAGAVTVQDGLTAVGAGKGTLLVDPSTMSDQQAQLISPTTYPVSIVYGLKDTIAQKREAVQKFVKAMHQAESMMLQANPAQLAQWCLNNVPGKPFAGTPQATLEASWAAFMRVAPSSQDGGFISQTSWSDALTGFGNDWGAVNWQPSDKSASYGSVIDMSFFNATK